MARNLWMVAIPAVLASACADARPPASPSAPKESPPVTEIAKAPSATSMDPSAKDYAGPKLPHGKVTLKGKGPGAKTHVIDVEIAATDASRTRGLMWRTELGEGKGMLFVFPAERFQSFWMRNTLIPLDMLFISYAGEVVGIVENAPPESLMSRGVDRASTYVLEVPGGWSRKNGVATGTHAAFEGVSMLKVQ